MTETSNTLKPGDHFLGPNGEMAFLKRARARGEWMLVRGRRARWGTTAEIREDIAFFEAHGKLPHAKVGGF